MKTMQILIVNLSFASLVNAQLPKSIATPEQVQATADIHEFFRRVTLKRAAADLADVKTLADWQRLRPVYRERLFEMLGLLPLPAKTALKPVVTGTVHGERAAEPVGGIGVRIVTLAR